MNRHPFRWGSFAFGLFFLAGVGNWAVWDQDLLTPRELSLTASGVLIVLGVLGVAATLRQSRRPRATPPVRTPDLTPDHSTEGDNHEATHPQP